MKSKVMIELLLKHYEFDFVKELKFSKTRKFRFDYAIEDLKIAIEYEGIMSAKARHTGIIGYSNDCEKYNLAQLEGWKVLRYTAINLKQLDSDLEFIKNNLFDFQQVIK